MSKYVRTKDYVYDTEKLVYGKIIDNKLYRVGWDVEKPTFEADIIEQSDNLADLCDGFYNDILNDFDCFGFDGLYIYNDFESFKEDWKAYRVHDNWEGDGYGFIKTSKGLIYVAKMNERGDLELI